MKNVKPYCEFVHRQLSRKSLLRPPPLQPPVKDNAIILLSYLDGPTLLADIFTLTEVIEEAHLTRLTATNRKGNTVSGTWLDGRYAWQNNVKDLHSYINRDLHRYHSLSFRYYHRNTKIVVQCVKDQIPLCRDLLPMTCEYEDVAWWASPPERRISTGIIIAQLVLSAMLFAGASPLYCAVISFIMIPAFLFISRWETKRYREKHPLIDLTLWKNWLQLSRDIIDRPQQSSLPEVESAMNALFQNTIERTTPGYDLLMRTRHRIAQELLDDIMQHDELPQTKFLRYRTRVISFIVLL